MTPRKLAGVLLGFGGVAVMIGPALLATLGGDMLAQLACMTAALCYALAGVWARRFKAHGPVADDGHHRPADRRRADHAAGRPARRPAVDSAAAVAEGMGAIVALAWSARAFAYILYFRLIDSAGATNALLVTLLVPPIAILLGALFLDEVLDAARFRRPGA